MTRTARRWTLMLFALAAAGSVLYSLQAYGFGMNMRGIAGILVVAIFWAAVIGGGIWLALSFTGVLARSGFGSRDEAIATLRQRYAQGEISRAEYFQMKQDLENES